MTVTIVTERRARRRHRHRLVVNGRVIGRAERSLRRLLERLRLVIARLRAGGYRIPSVGREYV